MLNNKKQPVMKGEVKMPLEEYNKLITELESYRRAVSITSDRWDENSVQIEIEAKAFLPLVMDTLKSNYPDFELTEYAEDSMIKNIARRLAKEENE